MSFEKSFIESKGKPISYKGKKIILIDRIPIEKDQRVKIEFVEVKSAMKQGIILKTKGDFIFDNGEIVPFRPVLWENTAPKKIELQIKSKNKELLIYNVWDEGNGTMQYWHNWAAMEVIKKGKVRTYYCNDGSLDTNFNDLVFTMELLG